MKDHEIKEKRETTNELSEIINSMNEDERSTLLNIILGFKLGVETAKQLENKPA